MSTQFVLVVAFGFGLAGLMQLNQIFVYQGLANRLAPNSSNQVARYSFEERTQMALSSLKKLWPKQANSDQKALFELPEIIDLIVVGLFAGDGIYKCLSTITPRCYGILAKSLSDTLRSVDYGGALATELRATQITQPQVMEFLNKTATSLERGTPLAQLLAEQSLSVRAEIRNQLLKQAGKNETRMLIPLVFLILPITVLFAIYPSLELLNFSFI